MRFRRVTTWKLATFYIDCCNCKILTPSAVPRLLRVQRWGRGIRLLLPRLAEAQHRQAQDACLLFRVHDSAYRVALVRPEMENTLAVLGRDGIMSARQLEGDRAVFYDDGITSVGEVLLQGAGERICFHIASLALRTPDFTPETLRHGETRTKLGMGGG